MRRHERVFLLLTLVAAFSLVSIPAAGAYVDPGTGSFIFQALVGGLLAAAFALKVFWRRLIGLFSGRGSGSKTSDSEAAATRVNE